MAMRVRSSRLSGPAACGHNRALVDDRIGASQLMSWTRLLKRAFDIDIDMQRCPNCSGVGLKIIAAILEQSVIEKILTHLGLQARAPPRAPARGQALQAA